MKGILEMSNPTPGFTWQLRQVMAERGILRISDLIQALTERGVSLSDAAIYRAISTPPERISLSLLASLCDALDCTPNDLLGPRR